MYTGALESIPIWGVFLITAALALAAVGLGFAGGIFLLRRTGAQEQGPVTTIVGAILALLAFVLALTYSTASANFETRRQLVVEDASAISSTYEIARSLPEPQSTEIRDILRRYVSIRVDGFQAEKIASTVESSIQLQGELWAAETAIVNDGGDSVLNGVFVQSLSQMCGTDARRAGEAAHHVMPTIWKLLYFIIFIAMIAVGYLAGISGKRSWLVISMLILAFSATLWLIADFDRPLSGTMKVSQQPMISLESQLKASP